MSLDSEQRFTEIANKLRAHDAAQRSRIKKLEQTVLDNRILLKELVNFFLDEGSNKLYTRIQQQIEECKQVLNNP